jgi:predicted GNAT family acetyltransferase
MDYTVKDNALMIKIDEKSSASVMFHTEGGRLYIDSTYTPHAHRGKGIGGQLMQTALSYAKGRNLKIVPVCSFSVEYFKKHTEYANQLWKG